MEEEMVCIPKSLYKELVFALDVYADNQIKHGEYSKKMIKDIRKRICKRGVGGEPHV